MEVGKNLSEKALYDYKLVQKAINEKDQNAYTELMDRYRESVYFMLLKMIKNRDDAEDLTIEAFGKAFSRLNQYVPTYAFSTWLFRIASNNCIDFIRKQRLKTLSLDNTYTNKDGDDMGFDVKFKGLDPYETAIKNQKVKLIRQVVNKLKPRYQELIKLRYFDELSYEEISEQLQIPLGTVKAQLFRARELLFQIMKNTRDRI